MAVVMILTMFITGFAIAFAVTHVQVSRLERDWGRFAERHGGVVEVSGAIFKPIAATVRLPVGGQFFTMRRHQVGSGNNATVYTQMKAAVATHRRLKVTKALLLLSRAAAKVGAQDITVGFPDYDDAFVIKGSDERWVRALFALNEPLRRAHLRHRARSIELEGGELTVQQLGELHDQDALDELLAFTQMLVEAIHSVPELALGSEEMQGQLSLAEAPEEKGALSVAGAGPGELTSTDGD